MPQFFDAVNDLTDILRNQLAGETNLQLILNEGATRGIITFPEVFQSYFEQIFDD
jgi:hypothetical protein